MGKFEQVKFQKGEWTYTLRNVNFTPKQIPDLMNLLRVGESYHKLVVRDDKQRTEDGIHLDCLDARNPNPKLNRERHEICVDSTTHDIVSQTLRVWGYTSDDVYEKQFSDFIDFGRNHYPRKFESLKNGHLIMSANVTSLQESPLDPKLLVPPTGAIERRECPDEKAPEVLDQPTPTYNPRIHGSSETDVQVTVLADGSLGDAQIVEVAGPAQHDAVMAALRKWKFKPAVCGTEPVVADMYIMFRFDTPFVR